MKPLLSRLALGWSALAAGLCLVLPSELATMVAVMAVVVAAVAVALAGGSRRHRGAAEPAPAVAMDEADLVATSALLVRAVEHAAGLPMALHAVARVLFQEFGAHGLVTGRLDDSGALASLDRFADASQRLPAPPRGALSDIAAHAVESRGVVAIAGIGFAVPVLRDERCVAWIEFKSVEIGVGDAGLIALLKLAQRELSALAQRSAPVAAAHPVAPAGHAADWTLDDSHVLLTRYENRRPSARDVTTIDAETDFDLDADNAAESITAAGNDSGTAVIDPHALKLLRELDPNGVNRLIERIARAFESSAARQISQLREGVRNNDIAAVRQVAQALRSAAGSIGALNLSRLCATLEDPSRCEGSEAMARQVKTVVAEIDTVQSVLRSFSATHP
jgi:HPt (histidine-containing phosphotransfer) domain-containing protein